MGSKCTREFRASGMAGKKREIKKTDKSKKKRTDSNFAKRKCVRKNQGSIKS